MYIHLIPNSWYCIRHTQNLVYCCKFRHIYVYSRPIQTYSVTLSYIQNPVQLFRILPYSESWYIQNLRYIQNYVKTYSGLFRTLCNTHILRTLPYSVLCRIHFDIFKIRRVFRNLFIYACSAIFNNNSYNNRKHRFKIKRSG